MRREKQIETKTQTKNANTKLRTALLKKDIWSVVDSFLLFQNEKKFNGIHKSFSQFLSKFENISEDVKKELGAKDVSWLFFEHFETQKIFARNVDEKTISKKTALHYATVRNKIEITKAVIEAGVDMDAKDNYGFAPLHYAAHGNLLKIGQMLVDAGASLEIKTEGSNETALKISLRYGDKKFPEMLCKKLIK
jgi:ankyrin repeat protein